MKRYYAGMAFALLLAVVILWPQLLFAQPADPGAPDDEVILVQISDDHITPDSERGLRNYARLKELLGIVKTIRPDLLIDTGDLTEHNRPDEYEMYRQAVREVGGFSWYPDYGPGISFYPIAGNHDAWGRYPWPTYLGPNSYSLTIGNYRFIGYSGHPNNDIPEAWLEEEMDRSCKDGRPIVMFYHYPPPYPDWDPMGMTEESWARVEAIALKYPVLAYLCGHLHAEHTAIRNASFFVRVSNRVEVGFLTLYALRGGTINYRTYPSDLVPLIITYPRQYFAGLDYTKTPAEQTKVRVFARVREGSIIAMTYRLDDGDEISMSPVGEGSPYWEAPLDARAMRGEHSITVSVKHSYGSWVPEPGYSMKSYFDTEVPVRLASACELTATPTATITPSPTVTDTPTVTPSPTATMAPSNTPTPTTAPADPPPVWLPMITLMNEL